MRFPGAITVSILTCFLASAEEPNQTTARILGTGGIVLFARLGPGINRLHRLSLDLLPNGTALEPLEITKLEMVPVAIADNTPATGVDDMSITADPDDIGYQSKFWIMAPCGIAPNGDRCSDDMKFKIPMDPASKLRMDCTLAHSEYCDPVGSIATSPAIPNGQGLESPVRWLGSGAEFVDHLPNPMCWGSKLLGCNVT